MFYTSYQHFMNCDVIVIALNEREIVQPENELDTAEREAITKITVFEHKCVKVKKLQHNCKIVSFRGLGGVVPQQ